MADDTRTNPKRSNALANIVMVMGVMAIAVAGALWWHDMEGYRKIDEVNERVAQYARLTDDTRVPPDVDWDELLAMNPEVVGWICVPNTVVNYPVMQGLDNEKYLNTAPDGSQTLGGSIFLDYLCEKPGMVESNSIIYGHHMRNGSQFKVLADMDDQEVLDGTQTVWYLTPDKTWDLVPLFVYYTTDYDTQTRQFDFKDDTAFREFLQKNLDRAVTRREGAEDAIRTTKHTLMLSTCNYYDGYGRTEIVCVPRSDVPSLAGT